MGINESLVDTRKKCSIFRRISTFRSKGAKPSPTFHFLKQIAESAPANRARGSESSTTDSWLPDTQGVTVPAGESWSLRWRLYHGIVSKEYNTQLYFRCLGELDFCVFCQYVFGLRMNQP